MNLPPELLSQGMENVPMDNPNESTPILAHFSPEEVRDAFEMLGETVIDPETNLFDLRPLEGILGNPEIRSVIEQTFAAEKGQNFAEGGMVQEGRPTDPELEKLRLEGRGEDTELVIISPELERLFTEWNGGKTKINPVTGFPEFGFLKQMFRIGAGVVGAVFGGPVGAGLAAGLAHKLTGDTWGGSLKGGLMGLGAAHAAPMIGGAFQTAFPGMSGMMGGATNSLLGTNAGGALANLFTPSAGGAGLVSSLAPKMGASMGASGASQAGAQGAASGLLSQIMSPGTLIPLAASGLMMAKGHKDDTKNQREYEEKQRQQSETARSRLGFDTPLKKAKAFDYGEANFDIPKGDYDVGRIPRFFNYDLEKQYAAGGGPIVGNGKGQQDNLPMDIKNNSYIIDASTVSDIGDGSTNAGIQELNKFFGIKPSMSEPKIARGGYVKAMVSDGEYEIPPEKVSALGKGSNQKGATMLKQLVTEIRAQKRTSGKKLPPKSKPLGGYLKRLHAA